MWEEYGVARAGQRRRPPHPFADRRNLDDVVFDSLKLTTSERSAVYEAVVDLVEARLKKAESLSSKERLKRAQAAERTRGIWAGLPSEEEEEA